MGPQQGGMGPQQGGMGPQQGGMGPQQGGMGPQQGGMGPQQGGMGPQQGGMGPQQGPQGPQDGMRPQPSGDFPGARNSPFPAFETAPEIGPNGEELHPQQGQGRQGMCNGRVGAPMGASTMRAQGGRMEQPPRNDHSLLIAAVALSTISIALSVTVIVLIVRLSRNMGYAPVNMRRGSVASIDALPPYASGKASPTSKAAFGLQDFDRQHSIEEQRV
eukprot:Opistho-2@92153